MGAQSKLAKDIINGCTKMELVVALFFTVHPYFEPTNDTNEAKFILPFIRMFKWRFTTIFYQNC